MKKIAVASMGSAVAGHFGHCEAFTLFDTEDGKILKQEHLPNPGHKPGFLPNFLAEHGVQVIIAGGMGGGAVEIFKDRGIQVITGAQGEAQDAVEAYLRGTLPSEGAVCHKREHADSCGGH